MPTGYVCVERDYENDDQLKEYFWIDMQGNQSEMFDDQWDAYYDARKRHLNDFQFSSYTDEEFRLIAEFDEILGQAVRSGRRKVYF